MNYRQFTSEIEKKMRAFAEREASVCLHESRKNNGVTRKGLTFYSRGSNIAPTIYLEEYYEMYLNGTSLDAVCGKIYALYERLKTRKPIETGQILYYESARKHLVCRLINYRRNREQLDGIPYRRYQDLAVVVFLSLEIPDAGAAAVQVTEAFLARWGITEKRLFQDAWDNSPKISRFCLYTMRSVIEHMLSFTELWDGSCEAAWKEAERKSSSFDALREKDTMYLLTNCDRYAGAVCLLYDGVLEGLARGLGENYYIIPSSIHEVIIVPESTSPDAEEIDMLIGDINKTQLETEEVLSDGCYYYERESGRLCRGRKK